MPIWASSQLGQCHRLPINNNQYIFWCYPYELAFLDCYLIHKYLSHIISYLKKLYAIHA